MVNYTSCLKKAFLIHHLVYFHHIQTKIPMEMKLPISVLVLSTHFPLVQKVFDLEKELLFQQKFALSITILFLLFRVVRILNTF